MRLTDHFVNVFGTQPLGKRGTLFGGQIDVGCQPDAVAHGDHHVALHGDPDVKLVSTISGETIWWARPPSAMTTDEHERLLRGNFFLQWRDWDDVELRIPPGHGCFVPSRWAHWLTHPGDVPIVSFEIDGQPVRPITTMMM